VKPDMKWGFKTNEEIRDKTVRVVGEDIEQGIFSIQDAILLAEGQNLDLVLISPTAKPPVCKIVDFQKFIYQQKKKQKELKAKQVKVVIKEIRFGPNTDTHDFQFKLKHARGFLEEGAKVKAFVFFRGRSIVHKEQGEILLLEFAQACEDIGKVEQMPKLEGKRMTMFLTPLKVK